ncbi:hypothetical protein [Leptothermofonsia sp. ETS-13]|uniref:hypothetical protein n=1 Tax=Leptothermofonsia sp. ETS-13 TaxID=3035696 RepID=UPI003B9F5FE3
MHNAQGKKIFWRWLGDRLQIPSVLLASLIIFNIFSPSALAETKQIRSTLRPAKDQTFTELMERAEAVAERLVRQTFAKEPKVTEVSVTVLGERNGQEVPLLFSTVSRINWKKNPKIQSWTTYFNNFSVALLGYRKPPSPPIPQPPAPVESLPGTEVLPADPSAPQLLVPSTTPPLPVPASPQSGTPAAGTTQNSQPPVAVTPPRSAPSSPISISPNSGYSPSKARLQNDPAFRDD